jgi:phospholipid/cholesterol/gamma-HCH transport system substrate-binding protein
MDDQNIKFRVGVMVLAALLILGILIMLVGEVPSLVRGTYTVNVKFRDAPGVAPDSPVRKSGIRIGRVSSVQFDEENDGVIVGLAIDSGVRLRRSDVCRISGGLLGDATLQFVPSGRKGAPTDLITDGEFLTGEASSSPLQAIGNLEGSLGQAIHSVSTAGDEITKLAQKVNRFFETDDGRIARIVDRTDQALESFTTTLDSVNSILGDEQVKADLRRAFSELPGFLQESRAAVEGIQQTVQLAGQNLRNLQGVTEPLGKKGPEMVEKIDRSVGRLDELLSQFVRFGRQINEQRGALGQLISNPELYDRLNRAATNIEQLTAELKPIIRDARLFSSKIAAHPELLGVRGAIKPSSGIK